MPTKKIPSSSGKLERVGPDREEVIGAEMVGEKEDGCNFCISDGSEFSKGQTVDALVP